MHVHSDNTSVLYEVNLEADAAIAGPFDTWLRDHVADMLQLAGFRSAEILEDGSAPPDRIRRVVQYRLKDAAALDDYLANHAPRMRAEGVARFGERYTAERRVLPHREEFVRGAVSTDNCLNCGEVLTGQHCSHCGQHASVRVLSLWRLLKDVIGDVLDADSRVWRTLWPLAFRPGVLTQDYLRGRRARYTPPFRMYLLLSLLFFVLASLSDPGGGVALQIDDGGASLQLPDGAAVVETTPPAGTGAPTGLDPETQRLVEAIIERLPAGEQESARLEMQRKIERASPEDIAAATEFFADPCDERHLTIDAGPLLEQWEPRLRNACREILADQKSFGRAMFANIPKMMFLFLPLIAAVMSVLYIRSGRYYVEHLLFVVHFHAFFFLAGLIVILFELLARSLPAPLESGIAAIQAAGGTALTIYVPIYLLKAMRRVYGQGWWKTVVKFTLLGFAYLVSLTFTGLGLLAYTALTL